MKRKETRWIDCLIILGLILLVFLLGQPWGRRWGAEEKEIYIGEEGAFSYDPDSYYYLRRARELTEGGVSSLRLLYTRSEDPLITAVHPGEDDTMPQLLSVIAALVWFFLRAIGVSISIYRVSLGLCSFILALFTIPIYLFLKKRVSRTAAVFGSLVATLSPPFYCHSCNGVFDTDALIGLSALILILSLYECFLCDDRRERLRYGLISFAAMFMLFFSWTAFFIYIAMAVGTAIVGLVFVRIGERVCLKKRRPVDVGLYAMLFSMLCFGMITGGKPLWALAKRFLLSGRNFNYEPWPSENWQLSELRRVPFTEGRTVWHLFQETSADYLSFCGGVIVFSVLLFSVGFALVDMVRKLRNKEAIPFEQSFLFASIGSWLLGGFVISLFGMRYMQFLILPVSLVSSFGFHGIIVWTREKEESAEFVRMFSVGIGILTFGVFALINASLAIILSGIVFILGFFFHGVKAGHWISGELLGLILAVMIIGPLTYQRDFTPYTDRSVEASMNWIKNNCQNDAVIVDYWNMGYIYQYYSERRTIADGGTYDGEFDYWLAEMLLTDDYRLSSGIAKMLQGSGVSASRYASELFQSNKRASEVLKSILVSDVVDAADYLHSETALSNTQIERLLSYSHPTSCPELYWVVNYQTFFISSALTYYRDWDFPGDERILWTALTEVSAVRPPGDETMNCSLFGMDGGLVGTVQIKTMGDTLDGWIRMIDGRDYDCQRILYYRNGEKITDISLEEGREHRELLEDRALMLLEENGLVSAITCEKKLPDSVLWKLFLFDGAGEVPFTRLYEESLSDNMEQELSGIQRKIGFQKYTKGRAGNNITIWSLND